MTHRSRLMRAVRECDNLADLRQAVIDVACDLEESTRDTIPAPPPVYDADREEHAPSTPLTLPAPAPCLEPDALLGSAGGVFRW